MKGQNDGIGSHRLDGKSDTGHGRRRAAHAPP
jgi:hypothetical protein